MPDQQRTQLATSFIDALRAGDANGFRIILTDDFLWTGILNRARTIVDYRATVNLENAVLGY